MGFGGPNCTKVPAFAVPGGDGGDLDVQQDDVSVVDPASILNFEGAGVTVTDDGGGKATVTIPGGSGGVFRLEFDDSDLNVAGVLAVNHTLGIRYNVWAIYDENGEAVGSPDLATDVDANNMTFDLSAFRDEHGGAIPGDWNLVIRS